MIAVRPGIEIDEREISYVTSRSSGPGGQNVNKVESRVTLLFDLDASAALDAGQKARIRERLATRVSKAGVLRVVSQKHRTQQANRQLATERFRELLEQALREEPPRRPTRVSKAARRRRLESKRRRGELKRRRRDRGAWDD